MPAALASGARDLVGIDVRAAHAEWSTVGGRGIHPAVPGEPRGPGMGYGRTSAPGVFSARPDTVDARGRGTAVKDVPEAPCRWRRGERRRAVGGLPPRRPGGMRPGGRRALTSPRPFRWPRRRYRARPDWRSDRPGECSRSGAVRHGHAGVDVGGIRRRVVSAWPARAGTDPERSAPSATGWAFRGLLRGTARLCSRRRGQARGCSASALQLLRSSRHTPTSRASDRSFRWRSRCSAPRSPGTSGRPHRPSVC